MTLWRPVMNDAVMLAGPPTWEGITPKLFTITDLGCLPSEVPSGPVRYELHHGRLLTMTPPAMDHCKRQLRISAQLWLQGEEKGYGEAGGEVGVILGRDPDVLYGPDAIFICKDRLPYKKSKEGYLETIPHLIVEVRS